MSEARVLVVQHFPADAPWYICDAISKAGCMQDLRDVGHGAELSDSLEGYSGLVVLGGPQAAAHASDEYPTLDQEIALFQEAHTLGMPALGVCLGAQVLARAAGGEVRPGEHGKEIGWLPIKFTPEGQSHPLFANGSTQPIVLHCHGDTFSLPSDITLLATSDKYPQIFEWGSCIGLQPHFEVHTMVGIDAFLSAFPDEAELVAGGAETIRGMSQEGIDDLSEAREFLFNTWALSVSNE